LFQFIIEEATSIHDNYLTNNTFHADCHCISNVSTTSSTLQPDVVTRCCSINWIWPRF